MDDEIKAKQDSRKDKAGRFDEKERQLMREIVLKWISPAHQELPPIEEAAKSALAGDSQDSVKEEEEDIQAVNLTADAREEDVSFEIKHPSEEPVKPVEPEEPSWPPRDLSIKKSVEPEPSIDFASAREETVSPKNKIVVVKSDYKLWSWLILISGLGIIGYIFYRIIWGDIFVFNLSNSFWGYSFTAVIKALFTFALIVFLLWKINEFWLWGKLYFFIWSIFITGIFVLAVGVYGFGWNDGLTNRILRYVPLPYGFVRYHPIWYGSYRDEYQAINRFREQQSGTAVMPGEIESILVRRTMANDLAWSYGLWVGNDEVVNEFNIIADKAGSNEEVARAVRSLWGISVDDYKQRVIRPYLLKKKLYQVLAASNLLRPATDGASDLQVLDLYLDKLTASTPIIIFGQ